MGQRDSKQHHANRRRKIQQAASSRAREQEEGEERAPLIGYETLYEISRSGRLYSRGKRAVMIGGYHHSPFIRITVNGVVVTLPKAKAVSDSFAALEASPAQPKH
jgi:hypothetical protein